MSKYTKFIFGIEEKDLPRVKESWNEFIQAWKDPQEALHLIFVGIIVSLAVLQGLSIADNLQNRLQKCDLIELNINQDNMEIKTYNGIEIKHLTYVLNIGNEYKNNTLPLKNCRWMWQE